MFTDHGPYASGRRRTLRAAAALCLAGVTLGLLTPASPAHAGSRMTPMDRCLSIGVPDATETVTHPGNQMGSSFPDGAGSEPGNAIFPGDVVRVTITRMIRTNYLAWHPGTTTARSPFAPTSTGDDQGRPAFRTVAQPDRDLLRKAHSLHAPRNPATGS
jgi:hypothetical protein